MTHHMNSASVEKLTPMSSDEITRNGTTVTMQLNPEQYERLFFQPGKPKGDLAKRLGNPTLLGVMGFVIPFQTTMWCLLQFKGANSSSLVAVSGSWYFIGGICMNLAGICEFVLGNTFPFAAFVVYGCHWINQAYTGDPSHNFISAYGVDGALGKPWNSGSGHYNVVMALVSFIFLLGSLRTNVPFVVIFLTLAIVFGFLAAADYQIGYDPTPEGLAFAAKLLKIGGGFGFVSAIMGWYLAIITVCASTGVPCPLPIFDLSQKVFPHSKAQLGEHAGTVQRGSMDA